MRSWLKYILVGLLLLVLAGCAPVASPQASTIEAPATPSQTDSMEGDLTVFAAASLTEAFGEIGERFMAEHPNVTVIFSFAGSQQLAQQIGQGAPADIFASANARQMAVAVETGRIAQDASIVFVQNRLVVVTPAANLAQIDTLDDLGRSDVTIVFAAEEVPVGAYAQNFLKRAAESDEFGGDYADAVRANIVSYEENVRAVLSKVILDEADAGIVYTSDVALDSGQVQTIDIPDELNTIAQYPLGILTDTQNAQAAQAFVDLVLSGEGQTILAKYGFEPVNAPVP